MSKTFLVSMPFAGVMTFTVEAENGEEAIQKASVSSVVIDFVEGETGSSVDIEEWDLYKKIVTGNIVHVPLWEAEYEEL